MKLYLFIARQFLASNKGVGKFTGIISKVGIAIGSLALVIAVSVLNGFEEQLNKKISDFDGHIKVSGIGFNYDISIINNIKGIIMVSPNRERRGIISFESKRKVVTFKEINTDLIEQFYQLPIIGKYPNKDQVLIGYDIASRLGVKVGDEIIISSPLDQISILGFSPAVKIQVSGLFYSKILDYDDKFIFIPENIGQRLFQSIANTNYLDIKIKDAGYEEIIKEKLNQLFNGNIKVQSWEDRHSTLVKAMKMEKIGSIIVLSLIILVASFNMVATLSLITIKKIKDIGILRLLGANLKDIRKILVSQALIIGSTGTLFGIFFGIIIVFFQNKLGVISLPNDIYAMDLLPMVLTFKDILIIFLICFFFIVIPGFFAGNKVSKFDPLEALRWTK
ncbi:MAG: hypothetical protein CBD77_01270 [bacterium TMED217]|nr:MAG: hypothetical protein CBD77_01270 [bacterium TMED217]